MDLTQLRYFLTTVKNRSFGRAAEELNVTQPALSKAVKRLELDLKVQLLDRQPRGVSPTIYGEVLAAHADLIRREVERARESIAALKSGNVGKVIVGAGSSMRLELLPRACLMLCAKYPEVEIDMIGELVDEIMPGLERGKLDLAVSMIPNHKTNRELTHIPLYRDQIHPTVGRGHPLLEQARVTPADTLRYKWILPAEDNLGRMYLNAYFLGLGLPQPKATIISNSPAFAAAIVRDSDCVGWQATQVIGSPEHTGLAALTIPEIMLTRTVGISYLRASVLSTTAKNLIEELKHAADAMIAAGTVMPLQDC